MVLGVRGKPCEGLAVAPGHGYPAPGLPVFPLLLRGPHRPRHGPVRAVSHGSGGRRGTPPYLAALSLAFFSNLCVSLTHYGGGPAPVYFGAGYVDLRAWWSVGFIVSLVNIVIWLGIGPFYWKALGLF